MEGGSILKDKFIQKRLAKSPGEDRQTIVATINVEDYDPATDFGDWEYRRFMTVDLGRNAPKFWYVIRAWAKNGDSRQITRGYCDSWLALDEIRKQFRVKANRVLVDSGWSADEVYTKCSAAGHWSNDRTRWLCYTAVHGLGIHTFPHKDGIQRFYGEEDIKPANLGQDKKFKGVKGCPYRSFSDWNISNILARLRDGRGNIKWVTNQSDDQYAEQMYNALPVKIHGKWRWEPISQDARLEYFDCEKMQVLAAVMSNILGMASFEEKKKAEEPTVLAA
jgi:hypothetical protein